MLQREHSAIFSTFIKLQLPLRPLFCLFLSGRFTQVLLYFEFVPVVEGMVSFKDVFFIISFIYFDSGGHCVQQSITNIVQF